MAWVEKRRRRQSDGTLGEVTWRARYRDANGRPRSRTFARKFDAERFLELNGADLQRGEWIDPTLRRSSFVDWADAWWATTAKLRPNTRRGYWLLLKNHILPYFRGARLGTIDYLDVEGFIAEKLKSGHGPKQVRQMVSILSLIMKCAVRANARKDNPAAGHALRVPQRRASQVPMLTMDAASLWSTTRATITRLRCGISSSPECARPNCAGCVSRTSTSSVGSSTYAAPGRRCPGTTAGHGSTCPGR
jgi:hypothetical protein